MYQLAAALCVGIAKNHPINDGNRWTALLAMRAFPYLNAQALEPSQADEVAILVAVADGSRTEQSLAP
jgi:death-on-curing protein